MIHVSSSILYLGLGVAELRIVSKLSLLLPSLLIMLLAGCSFSSDSNKAKLRILNVSLDYSAVDLYADGTLKHSNVSTESVSDYAALDADTYTISFKSSGASGTLKSFSTALSKKSHTTFLSYGRSGHFSAIALDEDQDLPSSDKAIVRVVNTATDAGAVDIYLTDSSDLLTDSSPIFSSVSAGDTVSDNVTVSSGTYRLRVTAAGSTTDIRLDSQSATLAGKSVQTLIITDTAGGYLVNAVSLVQQGGLALYDNTSARVRASVGISTGSSVTASMDGTSLVTGAAAASIGSYKSITAGSVSVGLTIDGAAVSASSQSIQAGNDYTLLIWDDSDGKQVSLISDDNRLPLASDGTKIRLLNAASGLGEPATLSVDFSPTAENIAVGNASDATEITSTSDSRLDITNTNTAETLFTQTSTSLLSKGVYTMFLFGDASSPIARLRKER